MKKNRAGWFSRSMAVLTFAGLLVVWVLIHVMGDSVWWALPILFGPRWVWTALLVGLLPLFLTRPRTGIWVMLVAIGILMFGILDFRTGIARLVPWKGTKIRVLEMNAMAAHGGPAKVEAIQKFVVAQNPDIIIMAECDGPIPELLKQLQGYHLQTERSLCLATKFTIESFTMRDPKEFWDDYGSGMIVRAVLQTPAGRLQVGLVHLATPRHALDSYFDLTRIPTLGPLTRRNTANRLKEAVAARKWIMLDDSLPTIIAGDFNTPVESAIYRDQWGDFGNSLSSAGWGFLNTKRTKWWGIRIDHILYRQGIHAKSAWVGPKLGSDHQPVVADLIIGG